mmetsp:Transcript_21101/g.53912  ORF Transcript_21101/g.53912 Transcript_21101/m.53912 type:complete len:236 (-) Transcript_21101:643-1350(-)
MTSFAGALLSVTSAVQLCASFQLEQPSPHFVIAPPRLVQLAAAHKGECQERPQALIVHVHADQAHGVVAPHHGPLQALGDLLDLVASTRPSALVSLVTWIPQGDAIGEHVVSVNDCSFVFPGRLSSTPTSCTPIDNSMAHKEPDGLLTSDASLRQRLRHRYRCRCHTGSQPELASWRQSLRLHPARILILQCVQRCSAPRCNAIDCRGSMSRAGPPTCCGLRRRSSRHLPRLLRR